MAFVSGLKSAAALAAMSVSGKAPRYAAPLLLLALSACASDYGSGVNGQRALSPEEMRLQAVETKNVELSRRLNAIEAAQQGGQVSDELRSLRGDVQQLQYQLDQAQKAQAQFGDLDGRVRRLESGGAAPGGSAPGDNVSQSSGPAGGAFVPPPPQTSNVPAASSSAAADEEAVYLKSFDLLKAGRYDDAIGGFRNMLAKYPQGNYADNAWYWMGESYNVKGDYPNALKSYQALLQQFPASPKVPDALLKTGVINQDHLQKKDQARAAFQQIVKAYPTSGAAAQARTRLAQLN